MQTKIRGLIVGILGITATLFLITLNAYAQVEQGEAQKVKENKVFLKATTSYFYQNGNDCFKKGDLEGAIKNYNLALEQNPNFAEAYYNRGLIYAKKNSLQQAISDFNMAIQFNSEGKFGGLSYYNRGLTYEKINDPEKAVEDYTKAIELVPDYAPAYKNRAVNYFYLKEYDKSWEDVRRVESLGGNIKMNPDFIKLLQKASQAISASSDGSSFEEAIIIKYIANDYQKSIAQEYEYLETRFGVRGKDWRLIKQNLLDKQDKVYDEMIVERLPSKETIILYFDITEPFVELGKQF